MEVVEVSGGAKSIIIGGGVERVNSERDQVRVKRKTLEAVLDQCQRALELLSTTGCIQDDEEIVEEIVDAGDDNDDAQSSIGRRESSPQDGEADLVN